MTKPKPTKLTRDDLTDKAEALEAIQGKMLALLKEAKDVLQGTGMIFERADAYWLGHIRAALKQDKYGTTILTTIAELRDEDSDRSASELLGEDRDEDGNGDDVEFDDEDDD